MQQPSNTPLPGVLAEMRRVMGHRSLDSQRMFDERFRLRVFLEQAESFVARHGVRGVMPGRGSSESRLWKRICWGYKRECPAGPGSAFPGVGVGHAQSPTR